MEAEDTEKSSEERWVEDESYVLGKKAGVEEGRKYKQPVFDFAREQYEAGIKEALQRYAWWKDGVQYVGTTGTTLKQALKDWGIKSG